MLEQEEVIAQTRGDYDNMQEEMTRLQVYHWDYHYPQLQKFRLKKKLEFKYKKFYYLLKVSSPEI